MGAEKFNRLLNYSTVYLKQKMKLMADHMRNKNKKFIYFKQLPTMTQQLTPVKKNGTYIVLNKVKAH
jgi:hypothetical protein